MLVGQSSLFIIIANTVDFIWPGARFVIFAGELLTMNIDMCAAQQRPAVTCHRQH